MKNFVDKMTSSIVCDISKLGIEVDQGTRSTTDHGAVGVGTARRGDAIIFAFPVKETGEYACPEVIVQIVFVFFQDRFQVGQGCGDVGPAWDHL